MAAHRSRVDRVRRWPAWVILTMMAVSTTVAVVLGTLRDPNVGPLSLAPSPTTTTAPTPTPAPIAVSDVPATAITEGAVTIGAAARAGLWATHGGPGCRWSRDKGTSWSFDTGGHPTSMIVVNLQAGVGFETHGCTMWTWLRA